MMKYFPKIIIYTILAFDMWFLGSYIEVVIKNLEGIPLISWNFFGLFL